VRLVFFYVGRRFAANARVLASRVIGLGNGPGGTTSYQSRLQFIDAPADAAETLVHIVEHIENERMQRWTSNASGDEAAAADAGQESADYFMRCRRLGGRWTRCWTRDAYQKMDAEGRDLIRATACNVN
jgi:hypothetical protein